MLAFYLWFWVWNEQKRYELCLQSPAENKTSFDRSYRKCFSAWFTTLYNSKIIRENVSRVFQNTLSETRLLQKYKFKEHVHDSAVFHNKKRKRPKNKKMHTLEIVKRSSLMCRQTRFKIHKWSSITKNIYGSIFVEFVVDQTVDVTP